LSRHVLLYINNAVDRKSQLFLDNKCKVFSMQGNVINTFMITKNIFPICLATSRLSSPPFPHLNVILFQCKFLCARSSLKVPQLLIFVHINHQIRQRRKNKKSIHICVQSVPPNWEAPHCCMCSCHCWSHTVSSSSTQYDYSSVAHTA